MSEQRFTAEQIALENWKAIEPYPKHNVECTNGHAFVSHAKFSGALIAIVSKSPCPVCGEYELRRSSTSSRESIQYGDTGSVEDLGNE